MEELKDLNNPENPCVTRDRTQLGGGALSSDYVSKLGSKEVSKKLRNFSLASKKACHCEDERSEDVAIAKSLDINEITTQSSIAHNDKSSSETNLTTYRLNDLTSFLGMFFSRKRVAFTLAEVLITLGIIGVVVALTLPSVVSNVNNMNYKIAYKKALSDVNEAYKLMEANDSRFTEVVCQNAEDCPNCCFSPAFSENFKLLAKQFRANKTCFANTIRDVKRCWECDKGQSGKLSEPPNYYGCNSAPAFIDNSGRAWAMYFGNESVMYVDTNGFKGPNHIGKDRWCFRLPTPQYKGSENYIKPCRSYDVKIKDRECPSGDCRYKSWLE